MDKQLKNGALNMLCGVGGQGILLVLGLLIPRLVITNYGSDVNGVINTVSQVYTYLALLEAGIATSARNALYKPVRENDEDAISDIMSMAKTYYSKVTILYLLIVGIMCFIFPLIVKTKMHYWTIFLIMLFDGATNIVSFYFIQKWITFLNVIGKNYIVNTITVIYKTLCSILKITLAYLKVNIVIIEAGYFTLSLLQLLIYYLYMSRKYGWINYSTVKKNAKFKDRNSFVITEIAWTVFSSTDMIVLSVFLSTTYSSVYAVYNMVFVAINGLLTSAYQSVTYILGQKYAKGIDQYKKIHDLFNSFFMSSITVLMSVTYWLIIPFIKFYTDGISDINYIYEYLPLLFCLVQLLSWSRYVSGNLSGLAGFAKQTSIVSLIEAIMNISLSLVFVKSWGITGVLFATVIALPLKVVYCLYLSERVILKRNAIKTLGILGINYLVFILTITLNAIIALPISSISSFICVGVILTVVYTGITFPLNAIANKDFGTTLLKSIRAHVK